MTGALWKIDHIQSSIYVLIVESRIAEELILADQDRVSVIVEKEICLIDGLSTRNFKFIVLLIFI